MIIIGMLTENGYGRPARSMWLSIFDTKLNFDYIMYRHFIYYEHENEMMLAKLSFILAYHSILHFSKALTPTVSSVRSLRNERCAIRKTRSCNTIRAHSL